MYSINNKRKKDKIRTEYLLPTQPLHQGRLGGGTESPDNQWTGGGTENETCKDHKYHNPHHRPLFDLEEQMVKFAEVIHGREPLYTQFLWQKRGCLKKSRSVVLASRTGKERDVTGIR